MELKTDSYAVESTIHFPTDLSLLYDSVRKSLDMIERLKEEHNLCKWRKINTWFKRLKKEYRKVSNIHQKKGSNYKSRLEDATNEYLQLSRKLEGRLTESLEEIATSSVKALKICSSLLYYKSMVVKHIDLVERRIIKGEKIPHSEKLFSIFEPHVEWIQKGKAGNKVELGHNVVLTTDQDHFILDHGVMVGESDSQQPIKILGRLQEHYPRESYSLESMSFDRGFYSKLSVEALSKEVKQLVMPSKGRPKKEQTAKEDEGQKQLRRKLMNKHSAVESNINELEHSGVNKVPDKGLEGFKNYVALGVLAYNIKRLGQLVIGQGLLPSTVPIRQAA